MESTISSGLFTRNTTLPTLSPKTARAQKLLVDQVNSNRHLRQSVENLSKQLASAPGINQPGVIKLHPILLKDAKQLARQISLIKARIVNIGAKHDNPVQAIKLVKRLLPDSTKPLISHPVLHLNELLEEARTESIRLISEQLVIDERKLDKELEDLESSAEARFNSFLKYDECPIRDQHDQYFKLYLDTVLEQVWSNTIQFDTTAAKHALAKANKSLKLQAQLESKEQAQTPEGRLKTLESKIKRFTSIAARNSTKPERKSSPEPKKKSNLQGNGKRLPLKPRPKGQRAKATGAGNQTVANSANKNSGKKKPVRRKSTSTV